jgi:hypothetical protein
VSTAAITLLVARTCVAVDVTQCGQVVAARDTGVLVANLTCNRTIPGSCASCPSPSCHVDLGQPCDVGAACASGRCVHAALRLENRASLDLAGFALRGTVGDEPEVGVLCESRCTVIGPGEVAQLVDFGIWAGGGLDVLGGVARISDVDVHDVFAGVGISALRLRLDTVTATSNALGIVASSIRADTVTASGNDPYSGINVATLRATNLTTNDNAYDGLFFARARSRFRLTNFTATGNAGYGIRGGNVILVDSTLTGNAGHGSGVDLATVARPRVAGTTCGKSGQLPADNAYSNMLSGTWGVCAGD